MTDRCVVELLCVSEATFQHKKCSHTKHFIRRNNRWPLSSSVQNTVILSVKGWLKTYYYLFLVGCFRVSCCCSPMREENRTACRMSIILGYKVTKMESQNHTFWTSVAHMTAALFLSGGSDLTWGRCIRYLVCQLLFINIWLVEPHTGIDTWCAVPDYDRFKQKCQNSFSSFLWGQEATCIFSINQKEHLSDRAYRNYLKFLIYHTAFQIGRRNAASNG